MGKKAKAKQTETRHLTGDSWSFHFNQWARDQELKQALIAAVEQEAEETGLQPSKARTLKMLLRRGLATYEKGIKK